MRNDDGESAVGAPNEGALPPAAGDTGGASGDSPRPGGVADPGKESVGTMRGDWSAGRAPAGATISSARAAPDAASSNATGTMAAQTYRRRGIKAWPDGRRLGPAARIEYRDRKDQISRTGRGECLDRKGRQKVFWCAQSSSKTQEAHQEVFWRRPNGSR